MFVNLWLNTIYLLLLSINLKFIWFLSIVFYFFMLRKTVEVIGTGVFWVSRSQDTFLTFSRWGNQNLVTPLLPWSNHKWFICMLFIRLQVFIEIWTFWRWSHREKLVRNWKRPIWRDYWRQFFCFLFW